MRDFTDVITDLDSGSVHQQAGEELNRVVAACKETNKVGTLTLTITIKPEGDMMTVRGEVKSKVPKAATSPTMFYSTDDGELRREDPRQMKLKIKNLAQPPAKPRRVGEPAAESVEKETDNGG